jgi:beta-alanine--pyruvate transaminase
VAAKDMHYWDVAGNRILDGTSGLWCSNAGHCRISADELGNYWADGTRSPRGKPHIIDIRTIGLVAGIELEPRPGAATKRATEVFHACFDNGLLVRATGDIIALSPPLFLDKTHIDEMFGKIVNMLEGIA